MRFFKNKYWLEFLKILIFGLLALSLRKIKFYIPGIEGVVSDLSEIALLISLFYLTRWWSIIPMCLIAAFGSVAVHSFLSAFYIHLGALLVVFYLLKYINTKTFQGVISNLIWIAIVIFYYVGMLVPGMVLSNFILGSMVKGELIANYLTILHHVRFEVAATITVTLLYFLNIRTTRDLEKKNLELEQAIQKAGEADHLKTAFLQNLSHEIRTPLNSIMGFSNLLEMNQGTNPSQSNYIKHILAGSQQLLNVVNDVVDASRIATQQVGMNLTRFPFSDVMAEVLEMLSLKAQEMGIEIETSYHFDPQTHLETDQYKLTRILYHLTDNAIKHCNKKNVAIKAWRNGADLTISVTDFGLGIEPEHRAIIYEWFRQIDSGITRKTQGNGLGLSIVKGFVQELNGSVTLHSVPHIETVFTVTLYSVFEPLPQ